MFFNFRRICFGLLLASLFVRCTALAQANEVVVRHRPGAEATAAFRFEGIESPSIDDAATAANITLLSGRIDPNSAGITCLNDGRLPNREDQPSRNFFFGGRRNGGRLLIDLGEPTDVNEVRAYSWHPTSRGPQVFQLYVASSDTDVKLDLKDQDVPIEHGWTLAAEVDTRRISDRLGGQYAALIRGKSGAAVGRCQYLLFEVEATGDGRNAATFFSEIDVDDGAVHEMPKTAPQVNILEIDGRYTIRFDTTETPALQGWVEQELMPVCREWYPRLVEMLPSEDFEAPREFSIVFKADMSGVAFASGTQITCAGPWYERNLAGEAKGSIVHEMVHIVQQYRGRRGRARNPGWMVEGLADYIRWFLYEPEANRPRVRPERANFDDSYRTSAAFLDFATRTYDPELIKKFNAKMRVGEYSASLWEEFTGKTPEAIWSEYVETLEDE